MADASYCPYCERWLQENAIRRLIAGRRRAHAGGAQRTLLLAGLVVFGIIAVACIVAAVMVA